MKAMYDVAIIGGGVVGSAVARELSRYRLDICVLEREKDVCNGVSGHNTGLLHSPLLYASDSLKRECCLEGNAEFEKVAEELDVPFKRCGKLIVGFGDEERARLEKVYQQGIKNGVKGLRIIDHEEIKAIEPSAEGEFALYVPSSGIMDPFSYTIALAENAAMNGVEYFFDHEVTGVRRLEDNSQMVETTQGNVHTKWVINCAGLFAYKISEMLGFGNYTPFRVRGQYEILDKKTGVFLSLPIYPTPNEFGAFDVHVTPTIDGNVLVGPTIENMGEEVNYGITSEMLSVLSEQGKKMFDHVKREFYIRNYAGVFPTLLDPKTGKEIDFTIDTSPDKPYVVNLVGINSPGLTSALPIARRVVAKVEQQQHLEPKADFEPRHRRTVRFAEQDVETKARLIEEDPDYGEIFCRCECVTKAEVKKAIHNILGVTTISGIKYRTRATMGRCQSGYCQTRITAAIEEELGKSKAEVLLKNKGSYMFTGDVK